MIVSCARPQCLCLSIEARKSWSTTQLLSHPVDQKLHVQQTSPRLCFLSRLAEVAMLRTQFVCVKIVFRPEIMTLSCIGMPQLEVGTETESVALIIKH